LTQLAQKSENFFFDNTKISKKTRVKCDISLIYRDYYFYGVFKMQMAIIPGFPHYGITDVGQVYNFRKHRFLKLGTSKQGYKTAGLTEDGIFYTISVARFVLLTFKGNPPIGTECCHNNGIKIDNQLGNLRWDTHQNNMSDAKEHKHIYTHFNKRTYKLSKFDVRIIIYMWQTGLFTQKIIASIYDVTEKWIKKIINRQVWRHVWVT
jgi:hypothetical protein